MFNKRTQLAIELARNAGNIIKKILKEDNIEQMNREIEIEPFGVALAKLLS